MARRGNAPNNHIPAMRAATCNQLRGGGAHKWGSFKTPCVGGEIVYGDFELASKGKMVLDNSINWWDRMCFIGFHGALVNNVSVGGLDTSIYQLPPTGFGAAQIFYGNGMWYSGTGYDGAATGRPGYFQQFVQASNGAIYPDLYLYADNLSTYLTLLNNSASSASGVFMIFASEQLNVRVTLA